MTKFNRRFYMLNEGDAYRYSWIIPEGEVESWGTNWKIGQTIKPYGKECHAIVGVSTYHCDQFMDILIGREQ